MIAHETHLPFLKLLGTALPIKHVLEFGAGIYSTPLFLDRDAFPLLESLVSYEHNWYWADQALLHTHSDTRLSLRVVPNLAAEVPNLPLSAYDLVFIDDGDNQAQRLRTIRAITACQPLTALVAVHDFHIEAYRAALAGFEHTRVYNCHLPSTGLCWNGDRPDVEALQW